MSASEKATVPHKVTSSSLPKRQVLRELGVPKSTYYRWRRRQQRLEDRPGGSARLWNRLTPQKKQAVPDCR